MSDIVLNKTIDDTLNSINNDIENISDILVNIYDSVKTLDEKKWNTKEKKIIEEEFLPYLKKISEKYPIYLNNRLVFVKNVVEKYKKCQKETQQVAEEYL